MGGGWAGWWALGSRARSRMCSAGTPSSAAGGRDGGCRETQDKLGAGPSKRGTDQPRPASPHTSEQDLAPRGHPLLPLQLCPVLGGGGGRQRRRLVVPVSSEATGPVGEGVVPPGPPPPARRARQAACALTALARRWPRDKAGSLRRPQAARRPAVCVRGCSSPHPCAPCGLPLGSERAEASGGTAGGRGRKHQTDRAARHVLVPGSQRRAGGRGPERGPSLPTCLGS